MNPAPPVTIARTAGPYRRMARRTSGSTARRPSPTLTPSASSPSRYGGQGLHTGVEVGFGEGIWEPPPRVGEPPVSLEALLGGTAPTCKDNDLEVHTASPIEP